MNLQVFRKPRQKIVVFLRGGPAVGKSTLAGILANNLPFTAKIEQDLLRYMIVGGLVASKKGLQPADYPNEYFRQCRLGDRNVFALARNFTEAGYLTLVAGINGGESAETFYLLENPERARWYPDPEMLEKELPGVKTLQVVLDAAPEILSQRLVSRGWTSDVIDFVLKQRDIFLKILPKIQTIHFMDTSNSLPEVVADDIIEKLSLTEYFDH
ncbi:MAG: hypothetical protein ACXAC5_15115 [Promethearchaeota archaeon]